MKQIRKRLLFPVLLLVCTLMLSACSTAEDTTNSSDSTIDDTLLYSAESLTETIVDLSQDDIDSYLQSGDEFTVSAMEAWLDNREDLGTYKEIASGEVEDSSDGYIVTLDVDFEDHNGEFVYTFDTDGTATGLTISPIYTFTEQMQQAGMNTLMGIVIVFVLLVVLSLIISLFRFIPSSGKKAQEKAAEEAKSAEPAPVAKPVIQENAAGEASDNQELIAVIAAAIAASEGTSTDGFVVRSIKKSNRKKW